MLVIRHTSADTQKRFRLNRKYLFSPDNENNKKDNDFNKFRNFVVKKKLLPKTKYFCDRKVMNYSG